MFTVTNLRITGNLDDDVQSVILAVQMEGSKRVLRSGDIKLPSATPGGQDISLDLSFSLQYAHFLKRDMNNLQVVMQRRKKYKNRTMLGYKSLAAGVIDLSKVLQSPADYCLKLVACQRKEQRMPGSKPTVAELSILNITSKPVMVSEDQVTGGRKPALSGTEHSPESEEEDGSGDDDAENDDVSDEEMTGQTSNRRNLKQRFIAMLRRFKTADDGEMEMAPHGAHNQQSLDRLFDELENLSDDSDAAEVDNLSVLSVPKPRLRPYFKDGSTGDMANLSEDEGAASDAAVSTAAAEGPMEAASTASRSEALLMPAVGSRSPATIARLGKGANDKGAALPIVSESKLASKEAAATIATVGNASADTSVMSHSMSSDWAGLVEKVFTTADERLPAMVLLMDERVDSPHRTVSQHLLLSLQHDYARHAVQASSETDVGIFVAAAAAAIQRQCNNIPRLSSVVKVVLLGDDSFFNLVLRPFVRIFSEKSPDWLNYIRFIPVPLGLGTSSQLCKHLGTIDSYYFSTFCDGVWTERLEHCYGQSFITDDASEMLMALKQYVSAAGGTLQFPISEAMIARHSDSHKDEKESQVFVPFLTEVKIGSLLNAIPQPEFENESTVQLLSVSPGRDGSTVPSSAGPPTTVIPTSSGNDPTELQLDYWLAAGAVPTPMRAEGSDPSGVPVQLQSQQLQLQQQTQTQGPQAQAQSVQGPQQQQVQPQQLQPQPLKGDKKSSSGSASGGSSVSSKVTLKSYFKFVNVVRSISRNAVLATFSLHTLSKEKKKMIRLGKKSKDKDEKEKSASKHATVEGICRLVCTSKDQSDTLKATIDGVEWKKIHFFQLSTQWQSHVKYLPLAISRQTVEA